MYMILSKYLQTQVSRSHQPSRPVMLAVANTLVIVPCDVLLRNGAHFTITFVLLCEVCLSFHFHVTPYANTRTNIRTSTDTDAQLAHPHACTHTRTYAHTYAHTMLKWVQFMLRLVGKPQTGRPIQVSIENLQVQVKYRVIQGLPVVMICVVYLQ